MKTIKELRDDDYLVEGINLRTVSAITLVSKSKDIHNRIKNTKTEDSELNKKLDLMSKQLMINSLLVAQLGLMSKKKR